MDIAVILRPNLIYFRSTVPEISDQSERSVTFWPVSPKPLKLAHFRLAPPPLSRALPFHWSCHKTNSSNPVLHYANERFAKNLKSSVLKGKDTSVAAERIGLLSPTISLKNTGPLIPWGPLKVQISELQRCWSRRSQSLPKTGTGRHREALGAGTGTFSIR